MIAEIDVSLILAALSDLIEIGSFGVDNGVIGKGIILFEKSFGVKIIALIAHEYVHQDDLMTLGAERLGYLGAG